MQTLKPELDVIIIVRAGTYLGSSLVIELIYINLISFNFSFFVYKINVQYVLGRLWSLSESMYVSPQCLTYVKNGNYY